jgi:hypothetical protein
MRVCACAVVIVVVVVVVVIVVGLTTCIMDTVSHDTARSPTHDY